MAEATDLPVGVRREAAPPERTVIVWTTRSLPVLFDLLDSIGLLAARLAPGDTEDFIAASGPPMLLLADPALLDEPATAVLDRLRTRSGAPRVCALAGTDTSAASLLTAMRTGLTDVIDPADPAAISALLGPAAGRERVLAIGAHPDDVEIGCGAALARHALSGNPVTVLTLSRGGVGGNQEQRRGEAVAAAITLGTQLLMADLPDTRLGEAPELVEIIEGVIAHLNPTTIYTHSEADNHQDHRATHRGSIIAARRTPRVFCYQSPSSRNAFAPTRFIPCADTLDTKLAALACYRSQSTRHYLDPELVVATARYWARQLPAQRYAEPFEVVRDTELQ
ncbi:PIG-L deacetylase family protein [Nocardia sp. NPDC050697]|uniref:PIG-L deacetylase family protein n=1 Tax=Nocardia sp. NPDC050697 TaxID=3155158 RepID=UPI0033D97DFA